MWTTVPKSSRPLCHQATLPVARLAKQAGAISSGDIPQAAVAEQAPPVVDVRRIAALSSITIWLVQLQAGKLLEKPHQSATKQRVSQASQPASTVGIQANKARKRAGKQASKQSSETAGQQERTNAQAYKYNDKNRHTQTEDKAGQNKTG